MSFLHSYLKYCEGNEAHPNYHIWSALVALSSIVGRRIWLEQGYYNVYPNLYVVLVGPPGNRKTTAMTIAKNLMREVGDIPFSAEAMSREGLIKSMSESEQTFNYLDKVVTFQPTTVCVTELKEFIGTSQANMINFLTTIWDQDFFDYKLRNKEDLVIRNPYVCILACETPEWITNRLRDDVISGGFSRRALFVYEYDRFQKIPFPEVTVERRDAWNEAIRQARALKRIVGPFTWEPECKDYYGQWYCGQEIARDAVVRGYYESKHILAIKVGLLIAVSEGATDRVFRLNHLQGALRLLANVETKLSKVFQGLGRNEQNQIATKVIEILELNKGPMSEKQLWSMIFRDADLRQFNDTITYLVQTDKILRFRRGIVGKERTFLCSMEFLPEDVAQQLARERANNPEPRADQPSQLVSSSAASPSVNALVAALAAASPPVVATAPPHSSEDGSQKS